MKKKPPAWCTLKKFRFLFFERDHRPSGNFLLQVWAARRPHQLLPAEEIYLSTLFPSLEIFSVVAEQWATRKFQRKYLQTFPLSRSINDNVKSLWHASCVDDICKMWMNVFLFSLPDFRLWLCGHIMSTSSVHLIFKKKSFTWQDLFCCCQMRCKSSSLGGWLERQNFTVFTPKKKKNKKQKKNQSILHTYTYWQWGI